MRDGGRGQAGWEEGTATARRAAEGRAVVVGGQTRWGRMERAVMFEFISLFKRQAVEYGVNFFSDFNSW